MRDPRFYVIEVRGWSIGQPRVRWGISYSVLDSAQGHAEVFGRYHNAKAPWGGSREAVKNRKQAYRECERLNALDRAAM